MNDSLRLGSPLAKLDWSKRSGMESKGHTMRKLIMSLLLASVAASPATAFGQSDREAARAEREAQAKEEREERQKAREERRQSREVSEPAKVEAPEAAPRAERARQRVQEAPASTDSVEPANPGDVATSRAARRQDLQQRQQVIEQQIIEQRRGQRDRQAIERPQRDRQAIEQPQINRQFDSRPGVPVARDARQRVDARRQQWEESRAERLARQEAIRNSRPPVISPTPRPGTQPPPPTTTARPGNAPSVNWSSSRWRKDRRYDWYKHRNRYWWLFQLGWYSDPFGWGYQPYGIGWRMWPSYYSSQYWLNDPWQYRLPYAPAGTRWIRYWDDAVLVDTWSGQVVDVIYNFFW
jgi:Nickel/cobalt transporter regulator